MSFNNTFQIRSTNSLRKPAMVVVLSLVSSAISAQPNANGAGVSAISDPFVITMIIVMIILLLFIGLLANVVLSSAALYRQRQLDSRTHTAGSGNQDAVAQSLPGNTSTGTGTENAAKVIVSALLLLFSSVASANEVQPTTSYIPAGLSSTTFYFLWAVLLVELLVIFVLLFMLRTFVLREKAIAPIKAATKNRTQFLKDVWNRLNSFKSLEQEKDIEMHHEYDGIRELDNRLPPWWLYGFYLSIIVSAIYLYRYHVSHSAPLPLEELQI
ncbi:MAG: hypothetical protein EOO00_10185, partial [Chitinophagaceae bacterium]